MSEGEQPAGEPVNDATRRGFLAAGLGAGLGAAAGATAAVAVSSQAPTPLKVSISGVVTPELYGAVGDGKTDDTLAIISALAANQSVLLDAKTYAVSRLVVVEASKSLIGRGGVRAPGPGSVLKCLTAAAGVQVRGGANTVRDLAIDGNDIADVGLKIGGMSAGDVGADGVYENVHVANCVSANWLVQGMQNFTVTSCRSHAGRGDGLVLDYGVGGTLWNRFEAGAAGRYNIRITQSGPAPAGSHPGPTDNVFVKCIAEQSRIDTNQVFVEHGFNNSFIGLSVYSAIPTARAALIRVSGSGPTTFLNLAAELQRGTVLLEAVATTPSPPRVWLGGVVDTAGGPPAGLFQGDAASLIIVAAYCTQVGAQVPLRAPGTAASVVRNDVTAPEYHWASAGTDLVAAHFLYADAQPRFAQAGDGTLSWGAGGASPADVRLARSGPAQLQLTGALTADRHLHPVLASLTPSGSKVTVDATASDLHAVSLTGPLQALEIDGMAAGQLLVITFVQAATAQPFTVQSVTGSSITGVRWQGGAAPGLDRPDAAVTCTFRMLGTTLYEIARSAT